MKVSVYIDGFNLYYRIRNRRAADGSTLKWLDLGALCRTLLGKHDVTQIRYFTAHVRGRPNPDSPIKQQAYLRALGTVPGLTCHFGQFLYKPKSAKLITPLADGTEFVMVHKTEEKGSDVNLASHLLLDGFRGSYEMAAVITNDSDLVEPIRIVRDELKLHVMVLDPKGIEPDFRPSRSLSGAATSYRSIRESAVAAAQFPETVQTAHGLVSRPAVWGPPTPPVVPAVPPMAPPG